MPIPTSYLPAILSLVAVGMWGTSDFLGGLGARCAKAFLFTTLVHVGAMVFAGTLALALGSPVPAMNAVLWSLAAGAVGGFGVALFYRALAIGKMGLIAPLSAVLAAGIATVVAAFTEGLPDLRHLSGFLLAGIGVWLISRTENKNGDTGAPPVQNGTGAGVSRPKGLGLAILAGCGFAGFFLCVHRAGNASPLCIALFSRVGSFVVTLAAASASRELRAVPRRVLAIAAATGILDVTGTIVFVRASQIGRLDAAVVLSSLYPAVTVILASIFLHERFSRSRTIGMLAALAAVPMIAG